MGGGFGGGGGLGTQVDAVNNDVLYASLQLDIPQRGTEYRFTTVRGDLAIHGRHIHRGVIRNAWTFFFCLVALGVIACLLWLSCWISSLQRFVGPSLLIMVGMLSVMLPCYHFGAGWRC